MIRLLQGGSLLALLACAATANAAGPTAAEIKEVRDKAMASLAKDQAPDGSYSARFAGPGVTALVITALLRNGVSPDDPVVKKALAAMEKSVKKDGGTYDKRLANYTTSVAIMGFVEANKDGRYDTVIKNATKFLRKLQYGENTKEDDARFGGAGYDGESRPDLSNTQYMVDAMIAAGGPKDDPAIQRALKFISRCQHLPAETNDQPFA